MMQFIIDNKEILAFSTGLLGILFTLAFSGILSWRHKICFEYESSRSVAVNILRGRYVQRASAHYTEVAKERRNQKTEVEEIYARPEQKDLIHKLAKDLGDENRVNRFYRWLLYASGIAFWLIWGAIILVIIGISTIWIRPSVVITVIWIVCLGGLTLAFIICVSVMQVLGGRFFKLVNRIFESEGE